MPFFFISLQLKTPTSQECPSAFPICTLILACSDAGVVIPIVGVVDMAEYWVLDWRVEDAGERDVVARIW
jgi:hypothetical protein